MNSHRLELGGSPAGQSMSPTGLEVNSSKEELTDYPGYSVVARVHPLHDRP